METVQYTIRGISKEVDARLRYKARQSNQSFNSYLVGLLQGSDSAPAGGINLDWLIGAGLDEQTNAALNELEKSDDQTGAQFLDAL
jgi:hypothetical protein